MYYLFKTKPIWIPIREENVPDFPFDVQRFNPIVIPREKDGMLKIKEFQEIFYDFLSTIIK